MCNWQSLDRFPKSERVKVCGLACTEQQGTWHSAVQSWYKSLREPKKASLLCLEPCCHWLKHAASCALSSIVPIAGIAWFLEWLGRLDMSEVLCLQNVSIFAQILLLQAKAFAWDNFAKTCSSCMSLIYSNRSLRQNAFLQPAGSLVQKCKTLDQARAVVTFLDAASEKTLRSTVALTAARGRGKVGSTMRCMMPSVKGQCCRHEQSYWCGY